MRILISYIILFFISLILQFSWLKYFAPYGLSPNIILILIISVGIVRGQFEAQLLGFALGLSWDVLSVDLFGSHAFLFTIIGYLSGLLSHKWNESKIFSQMILTGFATIFFWAGMYIVYHIFSPGEHKIKINYIIIVQVFYNMLVAPVIFKIVNIILADNSLDSNY